MYYSTPRKRRETKWLLVFFFFFASCQKIKYVNFRTARYLLVWYILKQIFTSVEVKNC